MFHSPFLVTRLHLGPPPTSVCPDVEDVYISDDAPSLLQSHLHHHRNHSPSASECGEKPVFAAKPHSRFVAMSPLTIDSTIKLSSGNLMPRLALGVYQSRGAECQNAVSEALKVGYRYSGSARSS
jgi:hypothetical protein